MRFIRTISRGGAGLFVREGWTNAIQALGWECLAWDGSDPERTFSDFEPDVYLADVRTRHRVPNRVKRGETRVAMVVDQWADPPAFSSLARNGYVTKRGSVRWVRKLDPDLLYHHTSPRGIERGWAKWRTQESREVASILLAGDPTEYFPVGLDDAWKFDIGFLGQYSPYKASGLKEYLLDYSQKYSTAIIGPGWPTGTALAESIDSKHRNAFFGSTTVTPSIHEPHAREYGVEVTERVYKVPLAGGFTICDPVACLHEEGLFTRDELLVAANGVEMAGLVDHFVRNPDEREPFIRRGRERILTSHTYFHRLSQLLKLLGFEAASKEVDVHIETALATGSWASPTQGGS